MLERFREDVLMRVDVGPVARGGGVCQLPWTTAMQVAECEQDPSLDQQPEEESSTVKLKR
jgi:hypothetical protein